MGAPERRALLAHLAVHDRVAAATQHGALPARVLLSRAVRQQDVPALGTIERAQRPRHVPVVCTREAVSRLLAHRNGMPHLMARLRDGAGVRLLEGGRLRVQDGDVASHQSTGHDGNGAHDRVTRLPQSGEPGLQRPLERGTRRQEAERLAGCGAGHVP